MTDALIERLRKLHEASLIRGGESDPEEVHNAILACEALDDALTTTLPALLDVAEAAKAWRDWMANGAEEECDLGPEECHGCALDAALARLEGE